MIVFVHCVRGWNEVAPQACFDGAKRRELVMVCVRMVKGGR